MIQCRGRNKWFVLAKAVGYLFHFGNPERPAEAAISISSKRPYGDMPPIYLSGPVEEMVALLDDLKSQILAEQAEKEGRGKAA